MKMCSSRVTKMTNVHRIQVMNKDSIVIGEKLTDFIAKETLETVSASFYVIVSDWNVASFGHVDRLKKSFTDQLERLNSDSKVLDFLVSPGEYAKIRPVKALVEDFMLENKCTRDSCLIALGGGVVGDMIGNSL